MQKFCTKCGAKLDEVTGKCPKCDGPTTKKELRQIKREQRKAAKKAIRKEKWRKLPLKKKIKKICLKFLIAVLVLFLLVGSGAVTLVYFDIIDIPVITKMLDFFGISESEIDDNDIIEAPNYLNDEKSKELEELDKEIEKALSEFENTAIDADNYFQNNSNVVSEIKVNDSDKVHTESEAYNNLVTRGFTKTPIETIYSMNGEVSESKSISETSSSKHPYYQTSYVADNGDVWTILEINGMVMANPVSYNLQSERGVQLIISEVETVTSYDCKTNRFYETIPNESELVVKTVSKIDAETLDNLTFGEIDGL